MEKLIRYLFTGLAAILLVGCQQEEENRPGGQGKTVSISLSVTGPGPATYGMPADEGRVGTVDVLVFKTDPGFPSDPSKGSYLYRATVSHTSGSMVFNTILSVTGDRQTLVVLANCRTQVDAAIGGLVPGQSKASVIQALSLSQPGGFDPATMTGIPMWGEITNQHITSSYNPAGLSVQLTRMLARIDIVNADVANFTLEEAYFYNPRQKGTVIAGNWNAADSKVTAPTAVSGWGLPRGTSLGAFNAAANKIEAKIYTFEADNKAMAASNLLDASCIVVGGRYRSSADKHYYRIDLKDYTTKTFFDILRNHLYTVTISAVNEEGVDRADDAYKGTSNIKATVEVWNQAAGDVQVGSSQLYVSQRYPWVKLNGTEIFSGSKTLQVKTSHPDGWIWKSDAETQQTLTDFKVSTTGGASGSQVTVVWNPENISATLPAGREGRATIVSGNLEYRVYFIQDDCGRKGVALSQKVGTYTYKTHRYPTGTSGTMECWMVENSKEGVGLSKGFGLDWSGNPIGTIAGGDSDRGKFNGYYYSKATAINACPLGWSVPNQTQWTSLKTAGNADLSNTGKWWGGPTGFANNAFGGNANNNGSQWDNWSYGSGYWSSSLSFQYYGSNFTGIFGPGTNTSGGWFFVRCVRP